VALATGNACAPQNVIAVAPGSTPDSLVFVIRGAAVGAPPNLLYGLSVTRCRDAIPLWTIAADGSRLMPDTLRYGRPVPGFVLRAGPEPLGPDCYRAVVSGAVPLRFAIDPEGRITTQH
jgi:hypothetical protein